MEQRKADSVQVEEYQVSHSAVVNDDSSISIPTNQNNSSGQLQLEIHLDATNEKSVPSNAILDANVTDPHQEVISNGGLIEACYGVPVDDIDLKQSNILDGEEITSLPMADNEMTPLDDQIMDQIDDMKEISSIVYNSTISAEQHVNSGSEFEKGNESSDNLYPLVMPSFDTDPHIWLPPDPVNKDDDTDIVANNDDNSDNNAAEGLSLSDGEADKNWLDIVASLSWRTALLVKPDANVGNAMDPCMYVKVKCIASGSIEQSEVINGLVFKKSAAHKQMRANMKNPRLLLLQGVVGHSSAGLLSMDSMKQENDHLEKILSDVIIKCKPDAILVEKAVSRNVNEYIHKQGVTVVSDMNIRRLERIARCTGSPILLLQNVLATPNLIKQCESLHFEKFIEEHNITGGGKRSAKTLLFLEGFRKPLGCTILLKGSTSEELKKVKRVLHFTVFAAYHLILETSFFADQRLFATGKNAMEKGNCLKTDPQLLVPCTAAPSSKICSDIAQNSDPTQQALNSLASDGEYVNQDDFVDPEKSVCMHDSKIETSREYADRKLDDSNNIQSYSSLPVPDPSRNLIGDISLDFAKLTSCDDFAGSTSGAPSNNGVLQMNGADGKDCLEAISDGISTETRTSLDSQNILISMSSQHIRNQAICEQSHLSRITYYGYFDTSLGRYLQDSLLNEVYPKTFDLLVKSGTSAHGILGLNWLHQLLLLGIYIWDVRLQHILQYCKANAASSDSTIHIKTPENKPKNYEITSVHGDTLCLTNVGMERREERIDTCHSFDSSFGGMILENEQLTEKSVIQEPGSHVSPDHGEDGGSHEVDKYAHISDSFCLEKSIDLPVKNELPELVRGNEMYPVAKPSKCFHVFLNLLDFSNDARKWIWGNFSHLEKEYKKELQGGFLDKFHLINKYIPTFSSLAQLKSQMDMVQFIVGPGGSILSIVEEEASSMIAYALLISEQQGMYSEAAIVKDEVIAGRKIDKVKEIRNGKETRTNFMVMENFLFGRNIIRRYDLKGALFSRYVLDSKNPENVLLDQNFIEDMRAMPIYIEGKTKNLLERAIWNDTAFLSRMTVMDYSLFVGVDKQKKELVFGIIDYLRQYTWDKQLESWVKTSLFVPKNLSPTGSTSNPTLVPLHSLAVYTGLLSKDCISWGLSCLLVVMSAVDTQYCTLSGKLSSTSIFIEKLSYKVNPQIGYVNKLEERAKISTPRFSYVVGAHTPERDFTRMRIIADKCVAVLMCDPTHISGLVTTTVDTIVLVKLFWRYHIQTEFELSLT
ncbi:Os09g0278300 [Oryza sativa Japonica Group]|uniref:1-phosphatidylinositol-3-phosphate 5-kinase n=1 Tax=Oryza sativa subsp. japonica TaxID=39947 RepID=A0A0P0XKK3_ORYSJ|nr:Os09g0278300 [Oryza sativa Japonica Group]